MRIVFAALLALALGFMPSAPARAREMPPAEMAMSCHEAGGDINMQHPTSQHDMQDCANHCLSQVNAQPSFERLAGPALINVIRAERLGLTDLGHPRDRDPPEPPPPRI